jgi:hypothetical protein
MDKSEYAKKQEDAKRKRREAAEHTDRRQIIGALERIAAQNQATENQAHRAQMPSTDRSGSPLLLA